MQIANASGFRHVGDVVIQPRARRLLWWTVSPEHFLLKNAKVESWPSEGGGPSGTISATEPAIKMVHPWWERAAFWLAGKISPDA